MIEYQNALARLVVTGSGRVPGVRENELQRFLKLAMRKRIAAIRALLPQTSEAFGRPEFERRYIRFARRRRSARPQSYRDEAIAFARSLGDPIARDEARLVRALGPRPGVTFVREGGRVSILIRLRRGGRLRAFSWRRFGRARAPRGGDVVTWG